MHIYSETQPYHSESPFPLHVYLSETQLLSSCFSWTSFDLLCAQKNILLKKMSSWDTHLYWSTIMQVKLRYRHITEGSTLPSSCLLPFPNLQHSSFSNEKHCSFPRRVTIHCLHTCVDAQTLAVQCHNPSDHLLLCPVWQPVSVLLLVSHLSDYLQPCGSSQSRAKSSEGRLTSPWIWSTLWGEGVLAIWKIPYQGLAFCLFESLATTGLPAREITTPHSEQFL